MGTGSPAAELHARDPDLDDDAAHPLSRPPVNGRSIKDVTSLCLSKRFPQRHSTFQAQRNLPPHGSLTIVSDATARA
jgi:hypothetical protein